jgi:hypothetical protein
MTKRDSENRKVNRRYRRAAERIWENSSLRDELDDEQARRLLDWGSIYLKNAASETAELPDEDAENLLQAKTERVSGVIRQVNKLTGAVANSDQQEITQRLEALRHSFDHLKDIADPLVKNREEWEAAFSEAASSDVDSAQIFKQLMTLLDGEEE